MLLRKIIGSSVALLVMVMLGTDSSAKLLEGRVQTEEELHRIGRPSDNPLSGRVETNRVPLRVPRPAPSLQGVVDTAAFAPLAPMSGQAGESTLRSGVAKSQDFAAPPRNFDLGAEQNSRELVLAWERWHKQLSEVIYKRWSARADSPGRATMRISVTSDRRIKAQIISSSGGGEFNAGLMEAVVGLNGNPGLTFPSKSRRNQVSFEADYVAASNVTPGFSWVKNDYERVREQW